MRGIAAAAPHVVDMKPGPAGRASLRDIAVWEAVKGLLVILVAGLAVKFLRVDADHAIDVIVEVFRRFSSIGVGLFAINALIIGLLWNNRTRHPVLA